MSIQKILFPTDFSVASYSALETAVSLARQREATLLIVHCAEAPIAYTGENNVGMSISSDVELQRMLLSVKDNVQGVPCETRLVRGSPWRGIIGIADKENIDTIVMGTHGRTGLMRVLMGSVAEAVVRHAPCPVVTVRQPERVEAKSS